MTADIADSLGMKKAEGAMVDQPQADSPAAKAGIKAGDVITAVNGKPVKDSRELAQTIGMMAPGTAVKLDVLHKGEDKTMTVDARRNAERAQANAETGSSKSSENGVPHLGLDARAGERRRRRRRQGRRRGLASIRTVRPPSSGFKTGDVILDVGGKTVANAGDVRKAMAEAHGQRQARRADAGEDGEGDPLLRRSGRARLIVAASPWNFLFRSRLSEQSE